MNRRKYLAVVGGSLSLAGCTGSTKTLTDTATPEPTDTPTSTPSPTPTKTPTPQKPTATTPNGDGDYTLGELRWHYEDLEIEVLAMYIAEETLVIRWVGGTSGYNGLQEAIYAADRYAEWIKSNDRTTRFVGKITDEFHEVVSIVHIKRKWARLYNQGDVTEDEYHRKVMTEMATPTAEG